MSRMERKKSIAAQVESVIDTLDAGMRAKYALGSIELTFDFVTALVDRLQQARSRNTEFDLRNGELRLSGPIRAGLKGLMEEQLQKTARRVMKKHAPEREER